MEKALRLKGAMIKGRPIVIKKSNRNITKTNPDKKRKRENEEIFDNNENFQEDKNFINRKKAKTEKYGTVRYEIKEDKNNSNPIKKEALIENKNTAYVPKKENEQQKLKMKNTDFKKFLNK